MIEKITTVKNPLTVIAIFAGIAEISGTVVLPFISEVHQGTYMWFLMLFPVILVLIFFVTLNFNHKVLYAPSDYQDEKNFMDSLVLQSKGGRIEKLDAVVKDAVPSIVEKVSDSSERFSVATDGLPASKSPVKESHSAIRAGYALAEQLVFAKLSSDFSTPIHRDVSVLAKGANPDSDGDDVSFDGLVLEGSLITAIEVKYFPTGGYDTLSLKNLFRLAGYAAKSLAKSNKKFKLIVAVVVDDDAPLSPSAIQKSLANTAVGYNYFIDIRVYRLRELEASLGLK